MARAITLARESSGIFSCKHRREYDSGGRSDHSGGARLLTSENSVNTKFVEYLTHELRRTPGMRTSENFNKAKLAEFPFPDIG